MEATCRHWPDPVSEEALRRDFWQSTSFSAMGNNAPGAILTAAQYTALVDAIAQEIASGALKPGDRLPPQRTFAYEHGIAASTAGRVYAELLRRGLAVGEVGRGTFVAGERPAGGLARGDPRDGRIDLEFNFPTIPQQTALIARSIGGLQRGDAIGAAIGPVTHRRLVQAWAATARFFTSHAWQPEADGFVFTGCGRQAIAAAISTCVPIGGRLAVEALSYPMVKSIAGRLGASIVPINMDSEGARPDLIAKAHRSGRLSALYLQPVLHNPLGHSMGTARREEIVSLAERLDIPIIEDLVYGFLSDAAPLAALRPDRSIVIDSMSKRLAPGIALGFLHVPAVLRDRVNATVRGGAWAVSPWSLEAGVRLMSDGTAAEVAKLKRSDAAARQAIVAECLRAKDVKADAASYHAWLHLSGGWRAETFAAAAARAGIAITPSSAFAMAPGHAPNAVRLALGLPKHSELRTALSTLARLLDADPEGVEMTE